MTNTLPVAYYLNDVDGEPPRLRAAGDCLPLGIQTISKRALRTRTRGMLEAQAAARSRPMLALARQASRGRAGAQGGREQLGRRPRGTRPRDARRRDAHRPISSSASRIRWRDALKPVLADGIRDRAVTQLSGTLNDLLRKGEYVAICFGAWKICWHR